MPDSRALVLAGGGVAGIAWELGVVSGLADAGIDVADADFVLGTSAGATVGAQITSGAPLADLVASQLAPDTREIEVKLDIEAFRASNAKLLEGTTDPQEQLARLGRMALEADTVAEPVRRAVIEARLPVHDWPAQRLALTVIDAASGEFLLFDRSSGVSLVDAVAASCAVPGVWPPVTIGERRYIDGGVRSLANADFAAGHERVLILVPMPVEGPVQQQLDAELDGLDADTLVVAADAGSIAAIGPNPLDPARRAPALRAGQAQAAAAADTVRAFWR